METKFNRNNLYLAELKYYSKENNGIEYCAPVSYVILYRYNNLFINIFNMDEFYPIFKRVPCTSNITNDDRVYGSKVISLSGNNLSSGPCFLLSDDKAFKYCFKENTNVEEIENYVINSKYYFKDRVKILLSKKHKNLSKKKVFSILKMDDYYYKKMEHFFNERNVEIKKIKNRNW